MGLVSVCLRRYVVLQITDYFVVLCGPLMLF
jgi:hypothetical protein